LGRRCATSATRDHEDSSRPREDAEAAHSRILHARAREVQEPAVTDTVDYRVRTTQSPRTMNPTPATVLSRRGGTQRAISAPTVTGSSVETPRAPAAATKIPALLTAGSVA